MSKQCKNKQYFTECMDGLFHKITEWCIKYGVIEMMKNCFSLPNNALMLCFDNFTCAHNSKTLLDFCLREFIFNSKIQFRNVFKHETKISIIMLDFKCVYQSVLKTFFLNFGPIYFIFQTKY